MIDPPLQNIIYFYSENQDTFGEIEVLVPGIQFMQRIPASMLDSINPVPPRGGGVVGLNYPGPGRKKEAQKKLMGPVGCKVQN